MDGPYIRTVLAEDGISPDDAVELTYFTTEVDALRAILGPVRSEFFETSSRLQR